MSGNIHWPRICRATRRCAISLFALALACVLAIGLSAQQIDTNSHGIVIDGGTLIDGAGGPPVEDSVIVIVGNKIQAIGRRNTVSYPEGKVRVVDAKGKFIIPGLIESHVHYPTWAGELFLAYGVTSVTDVGNSTEWIMAMKQASQQGKIKMPRLFSTGEFLTAPMSVSRGYRGTGNNGPYRTPVADVQEARLTVRRLIRQGVDGIKIWQNMLPEQLRAIAEEAHQANLPVMGHVFDAEEDAELGIDRIEHTHGILNAAIKKPENRRLLENELAYSASLLETERFDPLVNLLVRKGVYYDPLLIYEYKGIGKHAHDFQREALELLQNPDLEYIPADTRLAMVEFYPTIRESGLGIFMGPVDRLPHSKLPEYEEGYRKDQDFVRRFVNAGGKLCAGTDAPGVVPGLSLHQELQMIVDAGISPLQAIMAATKNPADFLRKSSLLGTLEPGKLADLVILKADPLEDIRNTKRIDRVMLDGKFVDTHFRSDYNVPFGRPLPYEGEGQGFFPVPALSNISPRSAVASLQVQIMVEGRSFSYASVVLLDNQPLKTTFVTPSRLTATVPASLLPAERTFFVQVRNPRPGGGMSNSYGLVVLKK